MGILELIHAESLCSSGQSAVIYQNQPYSSGYALLVTLDILQPIAWPRAGDVSFKCLPYQLSMVRDMPTMVITGNGESGFDSGEGA